MKLSGSQLLSLQISLLYALTIAGYAAVASMSTILGFDNRTGSILLRLALLVLCATVVMGSRWRHPKAARLGIWLLVAAFWMMYSTRIVWDAYISSTPLGREPYIYFVVAIGGCLVPMIAFMMTGTTSKQVMDRVRKNCLLITLLACVTVLWVYYRDAGLIARISGSRLSLEALNPISAGHLGGSLVIIAGFCLLDRSTRRRKILQHLLYWAALAIGLVLLVASASRGPILATVLGMGVYGISQLRHRNGMVNFFSVVVFFIGGAWLASYLEATLGFSSLSRVLNLIELGGGDLTASIRLSSMTAAWDQFLSSPLLGSGLEERHTRFYPHNVIIEAFMATGIVGGVVFTSILVAAGFSAWTMLVKHSSSGWVAILSIQYMVAAQFSGSIWGSTIMWSLIGAVFATRTISSGQLTQIENFRPAPVGDPQQ